MGAVHIPIIEEDAFDDLVTAVQSLAAPSGTNVAISPTGMHIVTEDNAQGAISELDAKAYEINSSLTNLIKSKNISGTTNAGGAVSSGLYAGNNPIIHCVIYSTGATYFGTISQVSESSDLQYITVHNSNGAIITNTAITGIVYYLDLSAL